MQTNTQARIKPVARKRTGANLYRVLKNPVLKPVKKVQVTKEFTSKQSSGDRGASPGERGHRDVKVAFWPGWWE